MKKQYTLIGIWLLLVLCFSACTKDDGYDYQQGYNTGKQSFEYTENNMAAFMSFFDLSLRMNAYLSLPEERREEMLDLYFPNYQVCRDEEGRWLGLKGQDTAFIVVPDDLLLTTETAVWKLSGCCEAYNGAMTVTCTGSRHWELEIFSSVNRGWVTDAHLKVHHQGELMPSTFNQGDWIVSGSGKSISEGIYSEGKKILHFEVAEPLIKIADSQYLFDKGILFMKVNDLWQQREETVKAELKAYAEKGRQLQITYKGEIYSYNDDAESTLFPNK